MVQGVKVIEQADRMIIVFDNPDAKTREAIKNAYGAAPLIDQSGLVSKTPASETVEQDINKAVENYDHPELMDLDAAISKELQEDIPLPVSLAKVLITDKERCNRLGLEECIWILQKALKPDTATSKEWAMADLMNRPMEERIAIFQRLAGRVCSAQ